MGKVDKIEEKRAALTKVQSDCRKEVIELTNAINEGSATMSETDIAKLAKSLNETIKRRREATAKLAALVGVAKTLAKNKAAMEILSELIAED